MSRPARGVQSATVSINVDMTNYVASGPAIAASQQEIQMAQGNDTITWNLVVTALSGYTVKFAAAPYGLFFKPGSGFPGTVTRQSDTQYTATDPNTVTAATKYYYAVIVVVSTANTPDKYYLYDPDVENETP